MTITFPRTFPTISGFEEWEPMNRDAIATTRSSFSYVRRSYDWGGDAIAIRAVAVMGADDEAPAFEAFLKTLRGTHGTFEMVGSPLPLRGAGGGTPLVDGASQTGRSLITDGWPNSTAILKSDDVFELDDCLYFVLQDVSSNGSGQATIDIWPKLRSAPANNSPITTVSPKGLFTFLERPTVPRNVSPLVRVSFTAIEAVGEA